MKCKTRNYITVKYKKNLIFDKRFKCNYKTRQNINFINVRNSTILSNDSLTIEENDIIEIHFINHVNNLNSFFAIFYSNKYTFVDNNAKSIISIDSSHFNSLLIKDICLIDVFPFEEIYFINFNISSVTLMNFTNFIHQMLKI